MTKPLRKQALEYLQYLKEQGITHVPATVPRTRRAPAAATPSAPPAAPRSRPANRQPPAPSSAAPIIQHSQHPPLIPITEQIAACQLCPLSTTRKNTVPGQGALNPDIMFVGEGPGADEDAQGLAFVGRAGQLLTKMIAAMGYTREQVFIGNIVKCRPPNNRVPTLEEMAGCIPYLKQQIAIIQPKYIVCLGATAARGLVQETQGITKVRGQWREFEGIPVMLTFHPAYLLRDGSKKKYAWDDLKAVLARLGKTPPQG